MDSSTLQTIDWYTAFAMMVLKLLTGAIQLKIMITRTTQMFASQECQTFFIFLLLTHLRQSWVYVKVYVAVMMTVW